MLLRSILAFKHNENIHTFQHVFNCAITQYPIKYSKLNPTSKSFIQYARNFSLKSSKGSSKKDYIDVEIVEDEDSKDKSNTNPNSIKRKEDKSDSNSTGFGLFNFIKKKSQAAIDKISNLISNKKEVDTQLKLKQEKMKEINNQIDRVFENNGIIGKIMCSALKLMCYMMIDKIIEQSSDIELVQLKVKEIIENDSMSKILIGYPIEYSIPQQSSLSSTSINGIQTKNVDLSYFISGNNDNGLVIVQAMIDKNNVLFKSNQIILQTSSGKIHNVYVTNNKSGKKDIVDVRAL